MKKKKGSKTTSRKKTTAAPRPSRRAALSTSSHPLSAPGKGAGWVALGWALTALALLNSPQFRFLLPPWYPVLRFPLWPIYLVGLGLIVYFLPKLPEIFPGPDLSSGRARMVFWVILGVAAYLRLEDANLLPSLAWDDHYIIIAQVRSVLDYSDYHLLFGHDFRPPFVTYFMCGLWTLLPKATGIFIVRLASTLIDMAAFWVLYLLGKELGGRRLGLILMAMGAFSKTLLETTKYDLGINEAALVAALVILFLIRVLRDPSLKHFLQLGAALGFTDYTYSTLRLFIPSVVIGTLAWIILDPQKRPKSRSGWILGLGLATSWAALFFTLNTFMAHSHPWLGFFTKGPAGLAVLAYLAYCYFDVWKNRTAEGRVWEWASGVFFAGIILTPLWLDPPYAVENNLHLSNQALWGTYYHFTFPQIVERARSNFGIALDFMFGATNGLGGHPFIKPPDCFMDYFMPLFGVLGLASVLLKPRWWKTAVLTLLTVGFVPAVLTPEVLWQHLLDTLVPLYLFSAWGAYLVWLSLATAFPRRGAIWAGIVLAALGALFLVKNTQWVDNWENRRQTDLLGADLIREELSQDRVYLAPTIGSYVLTIEDLLCEGKDIYTVRPSNEIDLAASETGKDLAVITYVADTATQDKLKAEFPQAPWFEKKDCNGVLTLKYVVVPFNQIPQAPGPFFYVQRSPDNFWDRKYYSCYGVARGLIRLEDRQAHWNDNLSPEAQGNNTVRVTGNWKVDENGEYKLEAQTSNILQVFVDGSRVLNVKIRQGDQLKSGQVSLSAGNHRVEVLTALLQDIHVPVVTVTSLSKGWKKPLDELADNSQPPATAPADSHSP